jgi:small multidrug resistance pump
MPELRLLYRPDGIVKGAMPIAVLLSLAIVTEVAGTVALRYSDGFTKLAPSAVVVVGYGASFWLLALVLRELSIGTTYAVWSAAGTALIAAFGILALGEPATALKLASLALIIIGVVGLNLGGSH